jgi:thiol-disulfide isomerase/thioredoxin
MTPRKMLRILIGSCVLAMAFAAHALPAVGDPPPDKLGVDPKGEAVLASAYTGKVLVITFWATWCPYCIKELPVLHNIQNKIGRDRLQVIAVNTEDRDVFRKAARLMAPLNMLHSSDVDRKIRDAYGVQGIPHLVIVGQDGNIVAVHQGYGEGSLPSIVADINRALAAKN